MPQSYPIKITKLICDVAVKPVEKTLFELFEYFDLPNDILDLERLTVLIKQLAEIDLVLIPDVNKGDFNTKRALRLKAQIAEINIQSVLDEINQGESNYLEFKSSLLYDYQKVDANPNLLDVDKSSDAVLFSTLKTIAAFLNSAGGILYIGVKDNGEILGIENDFIFSKTRNVDVWQLFFRDKIKTCFKDGNLINDWVRMSFLKYGENTTIARIVVIARSQLSYLKMPDSVLISDSKFRLFRRQGNRTSNTDIFEIEEFIMSRVIARQ